MLVLPLPDTIRLITQHDHARLAHDILALWTADGLPENPLREPLLLAVAEHDNGWREADAAPLANSETGWPCGFREYPDIERRRLWQQAVTRLASGDPVVTLLTIRHARRIHSDRASDPPWQPFFTALREQQELLEESCNQPAAALDAVYEFLWLADTLSLGACGALSIPKLTWRSYTIDIAPGRLSIHPFPFAGPLTLHVACRHLPKRRYTDASDLAAGVAGARWGKTSVRIEPH